MRLLLALAMTACLQNVDSTALDDSNGHDHFLKLAAQPQILAKDADADDDPFSSQVTITEMTLADRTPFGNDKELTAKTPLNDKAPLKFAKIVFKFTANKKEYTCTLESGGVKLSQQISFSLSACKCSGTGCGTDASSQAKGGNNETTAFAKCEGLLTHISDPSYVINDHTITKIYKDNKSSCDRKLYIGWYKTKARNDMQNYIDNPSPPIIPRGQKKSAGSFDAAVQFMNNNDITCEQGGDGDLKLIFPSEEDNDPYKEIILTCPTSNTDEEQYVRIGLSAAGSEKLLITIKHGTQDGATIYDAYDTNDKGQIIKHTRVDANRKEKVEFERD